MTLRNPFFLLLSATAIFASIFASTGCSADFEEDDIAQDSAELGGNFAGRVIARPITRARCTRSGGTISRSPASFSRTCTKAGHTGDVCALPTPAYDPSACTVVVVMDDKVATQPASFTTPCPQTWSRCIE